MNVEFKYTNGRQRLMNRRYADVLSKLGHGTYMTRDMRAAEPAPVPVVPLDAESAAASAPAESGFDLDKMEPEDLHALAKSRGVKIHHKAGADKVREALREAGK